MARTPEFDREQVLDAALHAFWRKGYEATTLSDLLEATGLATLCPGRGGTPLAHSVHWAIFELSQEWLLSGQLDSMKSMT